MALSVLSKLMGARFPGLPVLEKGHGSAKRPSRRLPFGHSTAPGSVVQLDEDFLRRLERLNLMTRGSVSPGLIGEHSSHRRASSLEFADYRRYVAGDDLRRIDWNVYGRLGFLFMKLTEAKEDVALHLLLDCSQSMNWGEPSKLYYARQLVAAFGYLALARFDSITVATFSDRLHGRMPMTRGKRQALPLLNFLNEMQPGGETDFAAAIDSYSATPFRPGIAIIVTDLLTPKDPVEPVRHLVRSGLDVSVVHVIHPHEIRPELNGELELLDVESGEIIEITVGQESIRNYTERLDAWRKTTRERLIGLGVNYVEVESSLPLESFFLKDLRKRKLLK